MGPQMAGPAGQAPFQVVQLTRATVVEIAKPPQVAVVGLASRGPGLELC